MIEYGKIFLLFDVAGNCIEKMELQFQKLGKPNGNHVMFDNYLKKN